jgi:hypothetical protein
MAAKGDVKAVQITAAAQVFAGNSQQKFLQGMYFHLIIPEDGILFKGGMTCSAITSAKATVLIDK